MTDPQQGSRVYFLLYPASLTALPFSRAFSPLFFMHITLVEESVSSLFVCSNGQVKWLVLGNIPSMAGRWLLWWRSLCPKMLAHTPAWQKTAQGKHPAALLCLSGVSIQTSSKSKHNLLIINSAVNSFFLQVVMLGSSFTGIFSWLFCLIPISRS